MATRTGSRSNYSNRVLASDLNSLGMSVKGNRQTVADSLPLSLTPLQTFNRDKYRFTGQGSFGDRTPALDVGKFLNDGEGVASLRDYIAVNDVLSLVGGDSSYAYRVTGVKDKSITVQQVRQDGSLAQEPRRLVVEKDKNGQAVGLKEAGRYGMRARFGTSDSYSNA